MTACKNCGAKLEPASYMHEASRTIWFDFICGGCGYQSEATTSRHARDAVAALIAERERLDSWIAHLEAFIGPSALPLLRSRFAEARNPGGATP